MKYANYAALFDDRKNSFNRDIFSIRKDSLSGVAFT